MKIIITVEESTKKYDEVQPSFDGFEPLLKPLIELKREARIRGVEVKRVEAHSPIPPLTRHNRVHPEKIVGIDIDWII